MSINKSNIIDKLANNYPSFYKKDLRRLADIFFSELRNSLKRRERVELRDVFTLETRTQEARISRNPKTQEKVEVSKKKTVHFKMSKKWFNRLNNE